MSPMILSPATALIVVDVQKGFNLPPYSNMTRSTPDCIPNIVKIMSSFRSASLPVIHIRHHSLIPTSILNPDYSKEGYEVQPDAAELPGEPVFVKHVNSAFIGTGLEKHLRDADITTLVVVGLTTSHCVSTTVRMAGNLGWEVYLPRDATAMYARAAAPGNTSGVEVFSAQTMHEVALAELHDEFATVVTADDVLLALDNRVR